MLALGAGYSQTLSFEKQSVYDGMGIINKFKHLTDVTAPVNLIINQDTVKMNCDEGISRDFKIVSINGSQINLSGGSLINMVYDKGILVSARLYDKPDKMWYVLSNEKNSYKNKDNTLSLLSLELTE